MNVLGIVGWSFDMDRPGKDSFRHRQAGAHEVLVSSGIRWALLHKVEGPEPLLSALLAKLDPVDLVLVEGYKSHPNAKLEVHRPSLDKPPIWTTTPDVTAIATDEKLEAEQKTMLPLNDPETVATWIMVWISRGRGNTP